MQYDEFVGLVQNRARLASQGEAVAAIHAVLETLGERLQGGATGNLAAQLPREVGYYLEQGGKQDETFELDRFFEKVAERESTDLPDAVHHARAVLSVVVEAVTPATMINIMDQLPQDYQDLIESGSEGEYDVRD